MMTQIKVLVAEDDTNIRMGLVDTLESEGYGVSQAKDGKMAMQLFDKDCFDLVLLDVMMPEKDGYTVCAELKGDAQYADIPILMLTAVASHVTSTRYSHYDGMSMEADDYLPKPASGEQITESIKSMLGI